MNPSEVILGSKNAIQAQNVTILALHIAPSFIHHEIIAWWKSLIFWYDQAKWLTYVLQLELLQNSSIWPRFALEKVESLILEIQFKVSKFFQNINQNILRIG